MILVAALLLTFSPLLQSAIPVADIRVDQAGYRLNSAKVAIVVSASASGAFELKNSSGRTVFKGNLSKDAVNDLESGDAVRYADFTTFRKPGKYYLDVAGVGRSWSFEIGNNVYSRAYYLAMRSYYGQRCGTAVDLGPEFPGYKYDACHLNAAFHQSSGRTGPSPLQGGWHDAGDYGRYVVNSGISTGTLLWTYEFFSKQIGRISLNIPESKDSTPDILNEIRWNLDWMLGMQDSDGGAWHKQTSEKFSGFVMPDKDKLPSVIIGKGTCASADLAAVTAIAARVFKAFDGAYADRNLVAARNAFAWAEQHPNVLFRNPPGVSTGAYGDNNCSDELLWAAAELYRTTRDPQYQRYFLANYEKQFANAEAMPGWPMVAPLAYWTYVLSGVNDVASTAIRAAILKGASAAVDRAATNGYRIPMRANDYVWGSNGVAANYAMQLLVANKIAPDPRFRPAAEELLHYLLGRNAHSLSFVTRVGENAMRHPHHRPTGAMKAEPWPGLLSGGPNRSKQDPAMQKLGNLPPAKMFLDEEASYATNEIAINWNAPLVFLLAAFVQ